MKATLVLSLGLGLAAHETAFATAAKPGDQVVVDNTDHVQLTDDTRSWLASPENDKVSAHDDSNVAWSPREVLEDALDVMQDKWFQLWVGTWPTAIDWTAAVMNTHLVASLGTLSKAMGSAGDVPHGLDEENDLQRYFSQNVAYYFGEDAFSIRGQAFDDMLWVVLGWLESVKTISAHSKRHYGSRTHEPKQWHGLQFIEAFSHRARIFYDVSSRGWDESFCGGGMIWSPYLTPYKNAITNELYISASIGMYLYFPGDNNSYPFTADAHSPDHQHDKAYLHTAITAYAWLKSSKMLNRQGLYVDGFHVSNYRNGGTTCDIRNEMVFTYNQGVILSGLRGLWEGTGNVTYLTDAHELVRNVIAATGWDLDESRPEKGNDGGWVGLGRNGILEERCDASGSCSQDSQTFKGIFFHHFSLLCEPLPRVAVVPGKTFAADQALAGLHRRSCARYAAWVAHNSRAAVRTRDAEGRFGMWWGADADTRVGEAPEIEGAEDYRNEPELMMGSLWPGLGDRVVPEHMRRKHGVDEVVQNAGDLNDRGRGRTVETQGGGIAVVRALWELMHQQKAL